MKVWQKSLLCISLSLMCLFTSLGYAQLSKNLTIMGEAFIKPSEPEGLYISDVEIVSYSRISPNGEEVVLPTNLRSKLYIQSQNATITYKITVHNKTDITYWYLGPKAAPEEGSNNLIGVSGGITITTRDNLTDNTSFDFSDWVPPQTKRVFYATYTFGSRATGNINTLVNFSFGLNMGSVSDGFLKVLNDKDSDYGYDYLVSAFEKQYAENGSTVIGNMGNDKEVFDNLFGSSITINVDGQNVPVTILVERQNVDGKTASGDTYSANSSLSGCEYTVYITVDDLSSSGKQATVYAVSYTCASNGVWYMIGELYEGKCTTTGDYDSSNSIYEGSFNVDSWTATAKEYTVIPGVSYKVGYEQGTEYDKYTTIEQLMSKFDQELYNKVNNNSQTLLKTVCNTLYTYTHNNGRYDEHINASNVTKPGYDELKSAFDRLKPYCYIGNGAQEVKIQNANSLSRAEIIQMLEEIQNTYDYFCAVNP